MNKIILPNREIVKPGGFWIADMIRPSEDNRIIWKEPIFPNLVVNVGLAELLSSGLTDTVQYIGLTGTTPTPLPGDTMASHAWTEFTGYDEATRELWDFVQTVASATNAANRAEFTITLATQTIGGLLLVNASNKGGATGTLYSVAPFSTGDRTGNQAGDIIRVTYIATTQDDGV